MADATTIPWEIRYSKSHSRPYFFDPTTTTSVWEQPANLTSAQVAALPGAHYLSAPPPAGKVRASHLLIKHNGSRNPKSWKEDNITRTKEEAKAILGEYEKELRSTGGPDELKKLFEERASKESDCSSHRNGGDLGWFERNQMQKAFEDATFATPVGEMSHIIETDSGVHLILRTG